MVTSLSLAVFLLPTSDRLTTQLCSWSITSRLNPRLETRMYQMSQIEEVGILILRPSCFFEAYS